MLVSTPSAYIRATTIDAGNGDKYDVPLWSPLQMVTYERQDDFHQVRIDERHCAIHHTKYPGSAILPPPNIDDHLAIPSFYFYFDKRQRRYLFSEPLEWIDYVKERPDYVQRFSYTVMPSDGVPTSVEGRSAVCLTTAHLYSSYGHTRHFSVDQLFYVLGDQTTSNSPSFYLYVLRPKDVYKEVRSWSEPQPTWEDIKLKMLTFRPDWSVGLSQNSTYRRSPVGLSSSYSYESLARMVDSILAASLRFEDDTLVECHNHLVRDENPLSSTKGSWMKEPSRGKPIWVNSDIDFLKGKSLAYLDALSDVKVASKNQLQNIAALIQALTSFAFQPEETKSAFDAVLKTNGVKRASMNQSRKVRVDLPEIPELAKDSWLGGRYVFSTSVSDLGSNWQFFYEKALQELGKRSADMKCHGVAEVENATFHCTFVMREKALHGIQQYFERLYRLGMEPNAYVLWDFVPFSFVVDWLLPIGDAVDAYTMTSHFTPQLYDYVESYGDYCMCYSVKYTQNTALGPVTHYTRWYESSPPNVDTSYVLTRHEAPSNKTAVFRTVDAICLIL